MDVLLGAVLIVIVLLNAAGKAVGVWAIWHVFRKEWPTIDPEARRRGIVLNLAVATVLTAVVVLLAVEPFGESSDRKVMIAAAVLAFTTGLGGGLAMAVIEGRRAARRFRLTDRQQTPPR